METNFKVDVPSFALGYSAGKKKAKKPVLTELTVTENGVYDKPVISNGPETITWDGNTDGKTFISVESTFFAKMSDEIFLAEDFAGYAVTMNDGHVFNTDDQVYALPGAVVIGEMAVISVQDKDAFFAATETLNFPENGTYFASNPETGFYTVSLTFSATSSTPADGWNKVTVNVPGDIIDVPELPTENIEEGKIYRITDGDIVTYGIPDANPVKRFVDGAWVDLT